MHPLNLISAKFKFDKLWRGNLANGDFVVYSLVLYRKRTSASLVVSAEVLAEKEEQAGVRSRNWNSLPYFMINVNLILRKNSAEKKIARREFASLVMEGSSDSRDRKANLRFFIIGICVRHGVKWYTLLVATPANMVGKIAENEKKSCLCEILRAGRFHV